MDAARSVLAIWTIIAVVREKVEEWKTISDAPLTQFPDWCGARIQMATWTS